MRFVAEPIQFSRKEEMTMKIRTLLLSLLALLVLGSVAADEANGATLVTFDFQNAVAGIGGAPGQLIVPASFLDPAFTAGIFSWTNPTGVFDGFTDHGV
jgi:hypothetical protein